jgi:periplasmic protein TonB
METSTILTADVLDIIFDGRNKEYGAYDLRRTYRRRLTLSITVMLSMICLLFIGFAFAGNKRALDPEVDIKEIKLASVAPKEKPVEPLKTPPPAQKPAAPPVQMKTMVYVAPKIVSDDQVKPDEKPPVNADLESVKIGDKNVPDGLNDNDLVIAPPGEEGGKGIIEAPKRDEDDKDKVWMKVEIESMYPGGMPAWHRFIKRNLNYPQEAIDVEAQGFVVVQFIVDQEGNVSNVEAVSGPQELRAEAVRVIKKSGKWTPAIQNGHPVKSYKKQPIGFQLANE